MKQVNLTLKEILRKKILEGLEQCKKDKTSSLDDFNMGFIMEFSQWMKEDIVKLFKELYEVGSFIRSLNSSFLVLIAKVGGAQNIKNFRIISLVE